jgi:ceramide glucosyltransferase
MFAIVVAFITSLITLASIFYFIAALWSARSFMRRRGAGTDFAPGVSILKSLKGFDPGMYEAFASHCRQQYAGEYELLFGVASPDDSAVAAVERLKVEFPEREIRLIVCPEKLGLNGKVSNLAQMTSQACHEYLIVNDSDIHVGPRYLTRIMAGFSNLERKKTVGMVTAPYRARRSRRREGLRRWSTRSPTTTSLGRASPRLVSPSYSAAKWWRPRSRRIGWASSSRTSCAGRGRCATRASLATPD